MVSVLSVGESLKRGKRRSASLGSVDSRQLDAASLMSIVILWLAIWICAGKTKPYLSNKSPVLLSLIHSNAWVEDWGSSLVVCRSKAEV